MLLASTVDCPECGRTFTKGELFCPYDRTSLAYQAIQTIDPLLNTIVNGSYTIIERLGAGGMGVVYRAVQQRLNRPVALKVLGAHFSGDPTATDRFRLEALAVSQLTNGHTVVVHDYGTMSDGALYIVMQLLDGESLRVRLQRGPLTLAHAITIAVHVCESLAEAHDKKPNPIIHRDIKPDNVFVNDAPHGEVHATVLDFGIARIADAQRNRLTSASVIMGTPTYMSPEQCRGGENLDRRSDLYSVGIMLFEMLTGKPPFESDESNALMFKQVYDSPPLLADRAPQLDAPTDLQRLISELLAKDPDARPQSAALVRARLMKLRSQLPETDPLSVPPTTMEARDLSELNVAAQSRGSGQPGVSRKSEHPRPGRIALVLAFVVALGLAGWKLRSLQHDHSSPAPMLLTSVKAPAATPAVAVAVPVPTQAVQVPQNVAISAPSTPERTILSAPRVSPSTKRGSSLQAKTSKAAAPSAPSIDGANRKGDPVPAQPPPAHQAGHSPFADL